MVGAERRIERVQWRAYALAQIADVVTTQLVIDRGGVEVDPLVRWLMKRSRQRWALAKLALSGLAACLVITGGAPQLLLPLALTVGMVAFRNWRILRRMP